MDRILIHDLLVRSVLGVSASERREKQDILINLALETDLRAAGHSDTLEDAIDYRAIKHRVMAEAEQSSYRLIEALAERIAALCLEFPGVQRVQVRVEKPGALRFVRSAGVEINRERT